jgi:hypothetical protein
VTVERRFSASFREADRDDPGLVMEDDGTIWLVNPDGTRAQLGGSAGSVLVGAMVGFTQTFDGTDSGVGGPGEDLIFGRVYDTDDFFNGVQPDYATELIIPEGLEGVYQLGAVLYVNQDPGGTDEAAFILDERSDSGDFNVRGLSGLGAVHVGSVSITRPLLAGDRVRMLNGDQTTNSGVHILGSTWTTNPDDPDGPGLFDFDPSTSSMTVTRIGPLPVGWTPY